MEVLLVFFKHLTPTHSLITIIPHGMVVGEEPWMEIFEGFMEPRFHLSRVCLSLEIKCLLQNHFFFLVTSIAYPFSITCLSHGFLAMFVASHASL